MAEAYNYEQIQKEFRELNDAITTMAYGVEGASAEVAEVTEQIAGINRNMEILGGNAQECLQYSEEISKQALELRELAVGTKGKVLVKVEEMRDVATREEMVDMLRDQMEKGYDLLTDIADGYQNSSKVFFDMMLDFQAEFDAIEKHIAQITDMMNAIHSAVENNAANVAEVMVQANDLCELL